MIRLEPGIYAHQAGKALDQQTGSGQQRQGQRDRCHDKTPADRETAPVPGIASSTFLERVVEIGPRQLQRRHDAEEEPGADGAREARTRFTALQRFRDCTNAEAELFTGRTHQIRVHAAHLGMPLAGDTRYADRAAARKWMARGLRRLFLHAHRLEFCDAAGNALAFSAPLPAALHAVLDGLPR